MEYLLAACISLSVVAFSYLVAKRFVSNQVVAQRITGETSGPKLPSAPKIDLKKFSVLTDAGMKKDLFLAGFRNNKAVLVLSLLLKLCFILPVVILVVLLIKGQLTSFSLIMVGLSGFVFYYVIKFVLGKLKVRRKKRIFRFLPQFLDLLVVCVEAGLGFTAAIERILKEVDPQEPLTIEFRQMYNEYLSGFSLSQACERLDKRCEVPELSFILNSLVQSDEMGSSLGDTLRVQSIELRDKYKQKMRERAQQIPIKMLFPLLLIFVTIFIIILGPALYSLQKQLGGLTKTEKKIKANVNTQKNAYKY